MRNPFEQLGKKEEKPVGEEVGGAFTCQERGCWKVVNKAIYLTEVSVLTWKCPDGHISSIKDFEL